jgi:hypothetical protein
MPDADDHLEPSASEDDGTRPGRVAEFVNRAGRDMNVGAQISSTVAEVTLAMTLGPLMTAFSQELGKRLGGSAADWLKRMHEHRRGGKKRVIEIDTPLKPTSFEVDDDLPDEARLALLDMDITSDAVSGQTMRWNSSAQAWQPVLYEQETDTSN